MACRTVQAWTLIGLVAAFLDLAIAYLLLWASLVAYSASKFLAFFGLHLPCPCDGILFNIRSKSFCLNTLFLEFPTQIVSHVLFSIKENFPFHQSITKNGNFNALAEVCVNGVIEIEGEASCSSVSDARKPADMITIKELSARGDRYDLKGKGVIGHRPRSRFRHRRKANGNGGFGKSSVALAHDPPAHEVALGLVPYSHSKGSISDNDDEIHFREYDDKASTTMGAIKRAVPEVELNPSHDEDFFMNSKSLYIEEIQNDRDGIQTFSGDENNAIKLLEQRLEAERIARAALYVELEKERSSAAIAADEAMAMILRLQEEKASIEMEARQYQRILEEKSVYDDEEMTILKEILIRREKEKHLLEKEVEEYRQMFSEGDEQIAGDSFCPTDYSTLIPHKLKGYTEKSTVENKFSDVSVDIPTSKLVFGNDSSPFKRQEDSDDQSIQTSICRSAGIVALQEKEIISVNNNLQMKCGVPPKFEKCPPFKEEILEQIQEPDQKLAEKVILSCHGTEAGDRHCDPSIKLQPNDTYLDVHIDGVNLCSGANASKSITISPSSNGVETEFDVKKRHSLITSGFPPIFPKGLSSHSEQRHSSRTPVKHQMVKIDSEVGWLRERLKLIQEGREKLGLSGENKGRANIPLKLLEDIEHQIEEIQHPTQIGKAGRQVSLPLPTSKAASKKRRSRSLSSGFQKSSEE